MSDLSLFIYCETSLHAGTGSTVSAVDLPIQRERTTRHPVVQGSGIKGALRSSLAEHEHERTLFGPSVDDLHGSRNQANAAYAGAMAVGDARIVLFPVRALKGVFAWITCPMVLARMQRIIPGMPAITEPVDSGALVGARQVVAIDSDVVLEEFSFAACTSRTPEGKSKTEVDALAEWLSSNALPKGEEFTYWRKKLPASLVVLSDDDFTEFTINSTEIETRVRLLPAAKTVAKGAMWTEESLPAETLLMSSIHLNDARDLSKTSAATLSTWIQDAKTLPHRIQIGGDETTGQGFVSLRWYANEGTVKNA